MKRCPKCGRTFTKDEQKFCTTDGGTLVPLAIDPNTTVSSDFPEPQSFNAPTVAISEDQLPPEPPAFNPYATIAAIRPETEPASDPAPVTPTQVTPPTPPAQVTPIAPQAPVTPTAPPTATQRPAAVATPPSSPTVRPAAPVSAAPAHQKKSKMPLILGILAILFIVGVGGAAAGYFFFLKPMLAEQTRNLRVGTPANENSNTNTEVPTPTAEATPTVEPLNEPPPFTPPAGAVQFVNSNANLDGKLAEHYLDFSFYYPESWKKDPQAGVPGASSFVNVQRVLAADTPERFAVGWYKSNGSFQADQPLFPKRVEDFETSYGKGYPGFRKVSEGPTKVNAYDAYELRFESESNDVTTWGRVIFLPPISGANGATLFMLATSEQPDVTGAEDVGVKGELPLVLESFRLGPKH
ncbi:MAG: hypothetical protein QOD75_204 [Blastocatellia bacterium]|jgi:hypothetical protein|nr:hypothetical protein [Blastocatellia bacterium]